MKMQNNRKDVMNRYNWAILVLTALIFFNAEVYSQVKMEEKNGSVVAGNSIVSATFDKSNSRIKSLKYKGRELLANGGVGYVQMYSHDGFASPKDVDFTVYKKTEDMIDLSFKQNNEHFPFIVDVHYVFRAGFSGIYNYIVFEYDPERVNDSAIHQLNLALRVDPEMFTHAQVEDDLYEKMPSIAELKQGAKVMDATYRLPADTEYAKQGDPVYTKYNMSVHEENHLAHGLMGDGVGIWILQPDREHLIGGPTAQELSLHQTHTTPVLLRHFTAGHFGSGVISLNRSDNNWKKFGGPWVIYVNSGQEHSGMWSDAKKQAQKQLDRWPFKWLEHEEYPLERSTVKGAMRIKGVGDQGNTLVTLTHWEAGKRPDFQRNGKGYYFWTRTDGNGKFNLENVRAGKYRLVAVKDGIFEEYSQEVIEVEDGKNLDLGAIKWRPVKHGKQIWQIGTPDRTAAEFNHGDDYRHWGILYDYPKEFPDDIVFEIGKSRERTDWNYVQPAYKGQGGKWRLPTWKVIFDYNGSIKGDAYLTIGVAGATIHANRSISLAGFEVTVNGEKVALAQSLINDSGASRSGIRGYYRRRLVKFDASLLQNGKNSVELKLAPSHEAKGIIHDFPYTTLMYDSIRLEVDDDPADKKDFKVVIVGDSTVTDCPAESKYRGWGQLLGGYFDKKYKFTNHAKSGESSKSFIMNGYWDQALKSDADYFLIQFGHNDCPNKGERTTDPQTTYKFYLQKYIDDVKALGSAPILVTPMERRGFNRDGSLRLTLDKYSAAMKEVALENDIALIDLHSESVRIYEEMGQEKAKTLGVPGDATHFNEYGAKIMADYVAGQLKDRGVLQK